MDMQLQCNQIDTSLVPRTLQRIIKSAQGASVKVTNNNLSNVPSRPVTRIFISSADMPSGMENCHFCIHVFHPRQQRSNAKNNATHRAVNAIDQHNCFGTYECFGIQIAHPGKYLLPCGNGSVVGHTGNCPFPCCLSIEIMMTIIP